VDTAGTFNYITDGSSPASDVLSDGAASYTPGISEKRSGTSKFYHGDAIGSTGAITTSSQASADTLTYDAFGNSTHTGSSAVPFGYGGGQAYQSDADSGLKLLGNRYYDSDSGRFLSADPSGDGDNWYAYAGNNPLRHSDPTGLVTIR
jgi:RHS repeat-associated protein